MTTEGRPAERETKRRAPPNLAHLVDEVFDRTRDTTTPDVVDVTRDTACLGNRSQ